MYDLVTHTHKDHHMSDVQYLSGPDVCARYGIVAMTLYRWVRDPDFGFPEPAFKNRDRRYWLESDLAKWERKRAREAGSARRGT
jgi:predicted DNA-binding transcriptional regulator AlpA